MSTFAITLLGTGSPLPDPHRAGPATLIQAGGEHYLVDAGRGVLMRLMAAGVPPSALTAVLVTHLHSDHITDLGDLITTQWIQNLGEPAPLRIVGPPGTKDTVDRIVNSLTLDIGYRIDHHDDLDSPPLVEVTEVADGPVDLDGAVEVTTAPTDHQPVHPTIGFRLTHGGTSVVAAGDTVPCEGLDRLCIGAAALVHTAIRKDVIGEIPVPRLQDVLDYHSSIEQAADTATRAGVPTLILTHYVPAFPPGAGNDWRDIASGCFNGRVEIGDDLHHINID